MAHLFTINGAQATVRQNTTITACGPYEVQHLEQWVVQHPQVLGDGVLIVATQI